MRAASAPRWKPWWRPRPRDDVLAGRQAASEIADYVNALFLVYMILIFVRILLSWIPRIPYNRC